MVDINEDINSSDKDEKVPKEEIGPNPWADSITVTMPSIDIKMVSAMNLREYEVWFMISTIVASFMAGFLGIYLQTKDIATGIFTLLLFIIFLISTIMTILARISISKKSKTYRLKSSGIEEVIEKE